MPPLLAVHRFSAQRSQFVVPIRLCEQRAADPRARQAGGKGVQRRLIRQQANDQMWMRNVRWNQPQSRSFNARVGGLNGLVNRRQIRACYRVTVRTALKTLVSTA